MAEITKNLSELFGDRKFLSSLIISTFVAGAGLIGLAEWNFRTKISVRPITEVVSVSESDVGRGASVEVKPISEIGPDQKTPIAWTGWVVRLNDLCLASNAGSFSNGFSDAFHKGSAKLIFPVADGGTTWTVANADISQLSCTAIKRKSSEPLFIVFDTKVSTTGNLQQMKVTFVPKQEDFWQPRSIP